MSRRAAAGRVVKGRWDWRTATGSGSPGHWEKERHGKHWREAKWEHAATARYVLVDGGWDEAPMYPTAAPPRAARGAVRRSRGLRLGAAAAGTGATASGQWVDGHFERERARQLWNEGRWEMNAGHYAWVEGHWGAAPAVPPLDMPPPPPRAEAQRSQPGYFWHPGKWAWNAGSTLGLGTRFPRERKPGYHYIAGHWERGADHWEWVKPEWAASGRAAADRLRRRRSAARAAPPAPRDEHVQPRAGFVWARGHYEWRNNAYAWIPGHWERARAGHRWNDGRWEQRGNAWVWVEGGWQ